MTNEHTRADAHSSAQLGDLNAEFRVLKETMRAEGLFDPAPIFSIGQSTQSLILLASALILTAFGFAWTSLAACILLALYYCMCAYIAHDVAHGQASRSRAALDTLFPILSAAQGLSLTWWKRKHSLHHAQTNVYKLDGGAPACVDGDIDTLPLFCWSDKLLSEKQKKSALYRTWLRAQRFTIWAFFPILRMQWVWHSLRHGKNSERALIVLHHAVFLALASWISPTGLEGALVLLFGANAIAGSLLASFFLFGHSGMHVRESTERLDEFREQVRATRNFSANPFAAWLTGGLNYQIEHHLFPTLPRGRLGKVAPRVAALAKKHGEDYQSDSIFKAYARVFRSLDMKI